MSGLKGAMEIVKFTSPGSILLSSPLNLPHLSKLPSSVFYSWIHAVEASSIMSVHKFFGNNLSCSNAVTREIIWGFVFGFEEQTSV